MSSLPLSPWPALGQLARFAKSTLEFGREFGELQSEASFKLLQAQLGTAAAARPSQAAQAWLDLQFDFMEQCCGQWKAAARQAVACADTCLGDMGRAENHDDLSFVLTSFLREREGHLRKAAEHAAVLLNSTHAAAGVLAERMLDQLIDIEAQGAAPAMEPGREA